MKTRCMAMLSAALLTMAGTALAADESEDPWRFTAIVPLWAPGVDGDITVRGVKRDVDIGFDELKDHLESVLSLGFQARKERFGFYTAFGYMKLEGDNRSARGGETGAELKLFIGDAGMAYRLVKAGQEHPFALEATAGLRYWYTDINLKVTGPRGRVLVNADANKNLYDPVIGLRGSQFLTRKLHLDFQGDVGGFGISDDTSDLDWSATGLVSYDFKKWFTLSAGYRALAVDKSDGSGTQEKGLNIIMHGLLLAAKFTF